MPYRRFLGLIVATFLPTAAPLPGQDAPARVRSWELVSDLGFVNTAGNSNVTSVNVGDRFVVRSQDKRRIFTQIFALIYGKSEGETTANNWRASVKYEHAITQRVFLYALAGVDRNRLAGIARRFEEGPGIIVKLLTGPRNDLDLEAGVSFIQQRSTDEVSDNVAAARAAAAFKHRFTEKAYFGQAFELLRNLEVGRDYRINTESTIVAPISRTFALKVAYVIRFDNTPQVTAARTFKKTDRTFTSGIQITF